MFHILRFVFLLVILSTALASHGRAGDESIEDIFLDELTNQITPEVGYNNQDISTCAPISILSFGPDLYLRGDVEMTFEYTDESSMNAHHEKSFWPLRILSNYCYQNILVNEPQLIGTMRFLVVISGGRAIEISEPPKDELLELYTCVQSAFQELYLPDGLYDSVTINLQFQP